MCQNIKSSCTRLHMCNQVCYISPFILFQTFCCMTSFKNKLFNSVDLE
uniref:Uncharacterized protein n=1 Tax=Triticum urartu TaxID=4572 RepID=A0A8R7R5S2_TRIUA